MVSSASWRSLAGGTKAPETCEVLFVFAPADISTPSNGRLISLQLDGIIDAVKRAGLTLGFVSRPEDRRFDSRTGYPVRRYPVRALPVFLARVLSLLLRVALRDIDSRALVHNLRQAMFKDWMDVLHSASPKAVVGIGLPDALCKAAKELGIWTAEVQHGLFSEFPGYYWRENTPDYFLAWDDASAAKATRFGIQSMSVGHPFMHKVAGKQIPDCELGYNCCVALSWGWQGSLDKEGSLSSALFRSATELQAIGFKMRFRPHPVVATLPRQRWRRYLRELTVILGDVEILNPLEESLDLTIEKSDLLLTHDSSCAFEFGLLGKPSIVLDASAKARTREALQAFGIDSTILVTRAQPENLRRSKVAVHKPTNLEPYSELLEKLKALGILLPG